MFIYVLMVLNTLVWGGTFIAGRIMEPGANPIVTAFIRFLIATVLLVLLCLATKKSLRLPSWKIFWLQALLGFIGIFFYTIIFHLGLQMVPAGKASVIVTTSPIFITIMAAVFYKERMTAIKAIGVIMAVVGTFIVVSRGDIPGLLTGGFSFGEGILLLCALSWATFVIVGKQALKQLTPMIAITWSSIIGTVMLFPAALLSGDMGQCLHYARDTWIGIIYLAVFSTFLGYIWYYKVMSVLGPTRASLITCMVPPCSVAFSIFILKEPAGWSLLVGGAITVIGVFIVNYVAVAAAKRSRMDYDGATRNKPFVCNADDTVPKQ